MDSLSGDVTRMSVKRELHSKAMLTLLQPKDRENKVLFIARSFTTVVIGGPGEVDGKFLKLMQLGSRLCRLPLCRYPCTHLTESPVLKLNLQINLL